MGIPKKTKVQTKQCPKSNPRKENALEMTKRVTRRRQCATKDKKRRKAKSDGDPKRAVIRKQIILEDRLEKPDKVNRDSYPIRIQCGEGKGMT
jgi:hypothetical protein